MERKLLSSVLLFSAVFVFTSCLKSNDDDQTNYADTAITAFSLNTLKQTKHVKTKAGKDSTYQDKLTASGYKFYIDQLKHEIYNVDSLPYGTDARKVLCTISAKNGGTVVYKSLTSDTLHYYTTKDSVDFSKPREFRVYNREGAYCSYKVTVNVRKVAEGVFAWHRVSGQDARLGALTAMKAVALNSKVYVMGNEGSTVKLYATADNNVAGWQQLAPNVTLDGQAYANLMVMNGYLYTYSNGRVLRSQDGITWEYRGNVALKQLAGGYNNIIYGVTEGSILLSEDGGTTWKSDAMGAETGYLPTQNVRLFGFASKVNAGVYNLVLTGIRPSNYVDDSGMVWGRLLGTNDNTQTWNYYGQGFSPYQTPRLTNLQVVKVGSQLLAFGGVGIGGYKAKAFAQFHYSVDKGVTWRKSDSYSLPKNFESDATSFAMTVDEHHNLWLIAGKSGRVWKGNLAGMLAKE